MPSETPSRRHGLAVGERPASGIRWGAACATGFFAGALFVLLLIPEQGLPGPLARLAPLKALRKAVDAAAGPEGSASADRPARLRERLFSPRGTSPSRHGLRRLEPIGFEAASVLHLPDTWPAASPMRGPIAASAKNHPPADRTLRDALAARPAESASIPLHAKAAQRSFGRLRSLSAQTSSPDRSASENSARKDPARKRMPTRSPDKKSSPAQPESAKYGRDPSSAKESSDAGARKDGEDAGHPSDRKKHPSKTEQEHGRIQRFRPPKLRDWIVGGLRPPSGKTSAPDFAPLKEKTPETLPDGRRVDAHPWTPEEVEALGTPEEEPDFAKWKKADGRRQRKPHWHMGERTAYLHDGTAWGAGEKNGRWNWLIRSQERWWTRAGEDTDLLRHAGRWWWHTDDGWFLLHAGEPWVWRHFADWKREGLIHPGTGTRILYSEDGRRAAVLTPGEGWAVFDAETGEQLAQGPLAQPGPKR
ncbi:MAG: hypothetical protein WCU88_05620 [Elusimicrobiota bacterium]|jgi:hypothetical protein